MNGLVTLEQQAALDSLGVTKDQFVFYHARRIDGRYLTQAVACLLIYDFLLTFGEEVQYIWKAVPRFSLATGLWFLNRYWSLASVCLRVWAMSNAVPPPIVCNVAIQITAWSGLINIAIVDILLMLRVWALYNGSRFIKWVLIGVFVVSFPTAIGLRKAPPVTGLPLVTPAPDSLTVCHRSHPSELFSLFTMALLIDTVIFGMVIYKAGGQKPRSQTPMLSVLVRDGALYYAAITAVLAFMIAATFIPILYQPVADSNLNIPLSTLACNRLILSLRGVYFRGDAAHSGIPTVTISYRVATNWTQNSVRAEPGDAYLHTVRSPNLKNDFQLGALHSSARRGDHQAQSVDLDWDQQADRMSAEAKRVNPPSASVHSRMPSFTDSYPNRGATSPTLSPTSGVPLIVQVTVTRKKRAVTDGGVELDLPVGYHEGTGMVEQDRRDRKSVV